MRSPFLFFDTPLTATAGRYWYLCTRSAGAAALALVVAACGSPSGAGEPDQPSWETQFPSHRPQLPDGDLMLVTNTHSDSISVLNPRGELEATVPVGKNPVDVDGPTAVVPGSNDSIYVLFTYPVVVADSAHAGHAHPIRPGYIQRLALANFDVLQQDIFPAADDMTLVEPNLLAIAQPSGFVVMLDNLDALGTLDADVSRVSVCPGVQTLQGCGVTPQSLFLACNDGYRTGRVDLATREFEALDWAALKEDSQTDASPAPDDSESEDTTMEASPEAAGAIGGAVSSLSCSAAGEWLAFGRDVDKTLHVWDTRAGEEVVWDLPGEPRFPTWVDERFLLVPTQGADGLLKLDSQRESPDETLTAEQLAAGGCRRPQSVAITAFGGFLLCQGDPSLDVPALVLPFDVDRLELRDGGGTNVGLEPTHITLMERGGP